MLNYVIVTYCKKHSGERDQIAVMDDPGEDCRLWEQHAKVRAESEPCPECGAMPLVQVAYADNQ